jgi:hypothetical protein
MPYQLNGQLILRKSQRVPHATGLVTAVGSVMSAAVAPLSETTMSNVKTPAMLSKLGFMVVPQRQFSLLGNILAAFRSCTKLEGDFRIAFLRIVATGSQ